MFGRKKSSPPAPSADAQAGAPHRLAPRSPSDAIKPMAAPPPPPRAKKPRGGFLSAFSGFLTLLIAFAVAAVFGMGVLEQPLLFEIYALVNRQRGQLKAGEFLFKAGTSIDEAIDTLAFGKAILHAISIPEGLTSEQVVARLRDNEVL